MEFVRGIHNLKLRHRGCALTIGNFDGFHKGHQSLVIKLREIGYNRGIPIMVMIFEPQPREYFFDSIRISSFRDKYDYFSHFGIDILLCVLFDSKFSLLDPYSFVSNILVKQLQIRLICVGDNFRFGAFRQGTFNFLKKMGIEFGFEVLKVDTCSDDSGRRISSTAIRNALQSGKLIESEILFGHPYSISGRVVYGCQLGVFIGFPTLNILLKGRKLPINGVYAVKVCGIRNQEVLLGVANIGVCPTLHWSSQQRLEVHLLDNNINLYGYYVHILICHKIRDEQYFFSVEELRAQIQSDIKIVKEYFNKR